MSICTAAAIMHTFTCKRPNTRVIDFTTPRFHITIDCQQLPFPHRPALDAMCACTYLHMITPFTYVHTACSTSLSLILRKPTITMSLGRRSNLSLMFCAHPAKDVHYPSCPTPPTLPASGISNVIADCTLLRLHVRPPKDTQIHNPPDACARK